jgi:hypothetical protein
LRHPWFHNLDVVAAGRKGTGVGVSMVRSIAADRAGALLRKLHAPILRSAFRAIRCPRLGVEGED